MKYYFWNVTLILSFILMEYFPYYVFSYICVPPDSYIIYKMTSHSLIQYHKTWTSIYVQEPARHLWLDEHISSSHSGVFGNCNCNSFFSINAHPTKYISTSIRRDEMYGLDTLNNTATNASHMNQFLIVFRVLYDISWSLTHLPV